MLKSESRPDSLEHLADKGYAVRKFPDLAPLADAVAACRHVLRQSRLPEDPARYHEAVKDQETHVRLARAVTDALHATDVIDRLFRPEIPFLENLLGPDIVVQAAPHLRVGRPGEEADSIGLHRDSFYGSSIWHLNCWFPLVPLQPGCGLLLAESTHVVPSRGVREHAFTDSFRAGVTKGTAAHTLGFVYQPRTDDTVAALTPDQLTLVTPPRGSYLIFFGCMVHGAKNDSQATRWSVDVRFSRPDDNASTRPGYFRVFKQGLISRVAERFYAA